MKRLPRNKKTLPTCKTKKRRKGGRKRREKEEEYRTEYKNGEGRTAKGMKGSKKMTKDEK